MEQKIASLCFSCCVILCGGLSGTFAKPDFNLIPAVFTIPEDSAAQTLVATFEISFPNETIDNVVLTPTSPFQLRWFQLNVSGPGVYIVEVTLIGVNLLDFETLNQYNMTVSVTNVNGTSSEVFFIEVTDVNEPPICSDQSPAGAHIHILEDAPHATIVYRVRATDPDHGDIISFSLLSVDPVSGLSQFNFNEAQGMLTVSSSGFDCTADTNFLLDIMVKDQNGLSCNLTLTVTVVNLDDNDLVFTAPSERVFWISEEEPQDHLVTVVAVNDTEVFFTFVNHVEGFYITPGTGEVKTAFKLDVDDKPELQNNYILVRATNYIHQRSVTLSLTVYVMDINDNPPVCSYYQRILQIPETTPVNYAVVDVSCTDRDVTSPNNVLIYSLSTDANSEGRFIMTEATLKINSSLDYDTADLASVDYKYNLKIEVYDLGVNISLTSTVTVIVVVTPVNEFSPICTGPVRFSIFEDQEVGDSVSPNKPSCTDQDYPLDNLRYSMIDDSAHFYIDPKTGIIQLLNPVDRETKATYRVTIKVEDFDQDTDTTNVKTIFQDYQIVILNVNDEPPVCDPGIYDITIYSTLAAGGSVVQLKCDDVDSLDGELEYGIVGGNTNGRFVLSNAKPPSVLTLSTFSYFNLGGINDPQDFQLLVKISDEGLAADKTRRLSSTATVLIHVVPWITTAPTTVTTTVFTTRIITIFDYYWKPDSWFIAVMTIIALALLAIIGLISYFCWKGMPCCWKFCKPSPSVKDPPLLKADELTDESSSSQKEKAHKNVPKPASSPEFDGRARDPMTGNEYLFNSVTGQRRWI